MVNTDSMWSSQTHCPVCVPITNKPWEKNGNQIGEILLYLYKPKQYAAF